MRHHAQVRVHPRRAAADDVVQRVPRRVVRVAHERLDQERPHPATYTTPEELAVIARTTDSSNERKEMRAGHGGGHDLTPE